ncbi:LysR substrate-binding domain-containing protein [Bradyrhizobium sp. LHD-71]|uniref:LysR family transcriptional regulator n=1 Tax=Bradyrhizobium sp. LHD-71 TaxID=3072141 RepID=UPI00280D3F54|nr:LysR substrate-binding domain-containing protein [Bradyrhizobium sp. LHD-71]MDQ8728022.1 LysR substrate-binding domain-containing protein [Bradyrhizobium sp. LHD-71]
MRINFKLLGTFLAVAENASFSKAAEQTHISLPAVSMQVKNLEERLGVALFQRTTRRVELTVEGEQLMVSARKAMAELDSALTRIQQAADMQQGHLSLACVPTVASAKLPALMTSFARQHPRISVRVRELMQPELLQAVRRREVDFAIGPEPERLGEFQFRAIFVDDYMALLPADHSAAVKSSVTLREVVKMPLLALGASQFHLQLLKALRAAKLEPELNYEFTHVSTIVAMAEAGLGVAIMPRLAVPSHTKLKPLRIVRPSIARTIGVVSIRGHTLSPSAARFVEMCNALMPAQAGD